MRMTTDELRRQREKKRRQLNRLLEAGAPKKSALEYDQAGLEFQACKQQIAQRNRLLRPTADRME
jgi:hypothetical protein